ncbi:hypothetical protein V6N11_078913 [Hibiscus sabdariffa]|uniref:Uncharacterized protein n=1 Tax=Hibiscus sabdariffa TaxID=183260 RepID=A0ABR2RTV3_9ROSI
MDGENCHNLVMIVRHSKIIESQESVGGMMRIVLSDIDNDADYWLLSDVDVSIADMWKTDSGVEWSGADMLNPDFVMADVEMLATGDDAVVSLAILQLGDNGESR